MLRNRGAALAFLALLALGVYAGFLSISSAPQPITQTSCAGENHQKGKCAIDDDPSLFFKIAAWGAENDKAILALTAIDALFAATILTVVTAFLWGATSKLATATIELRDAGHEQAGEMRRANTLGEKNFDLAEKQFLLAGQECDLAGKQHGLQRLQWLAEHRPRIRIRSVAITHAPNGRLFQAGQIIKGSLVIVNAGASEATIRRTEYRFYWSGHDLPMAPPLDPEQVQPLLVTVPHQMKGHESCLVPIESETSLGPEADSILGGNYGLFIMGSVLYSDWDLTERWMGFCRQYTLPKIHGSEGSFLPVDNPAYEYED
jgi:hypothetical protein